MFENRAKPRRFIMNGSEIDNHKKGPIVLIAEEHDMFRTRLCDLVTSHFPNSEVIEANNGWRALSKALVYRPEVILMDLALPEMDGLETTRLIKKILSESHVVIMTMTEDSLYDAAAVLAGANNYIVKDRIGTDLVPILTDLLAA
jgi:DNA-binding NarL/FixJ family response regulator